MNLKALTKAELIKEIERLRRTPQRKPKIIRAKKRDTESKILAGMDILKDDLLVVDEAKRLAFVHPIVKTEAGKIRIHGYAVRDFKEGRQVRIRHWFTNEVS
jgi:hypothetical protein